MSSINNSRKKMINAMNYTVPESSYSALDYTAPNMDESNLFGISFKSKCRKMCLEKLGKKAQGLNDCISECKGKGERASKRKQREIEIEEKQDIPNKFDSSI